MAILDNAGSALELRQVDGGGADGDAGGGAVSVLFCSWPWLQGQGVPFGRGEAIARLVITAGSMPTPVTTGMDYWVVPVGNALPTGSWDAQTARYGL